MSDRLQRLVEANNKLLARLKQVEKPNPDDYEVSDDCGYAVRHKD